MQRSGRGGLAGNCPTVIGACLLATSAVALSGGTKDLPGSPQAKQTLELSDPTASTPSIPEPATIQSAADEGAAASSAFSYDEASLRVAEGGLAIQTQVAGYTFWTTVFAGIAAITGLFGVWLLASTLRYTRQTAAAANASANAADTAARAALEQGKQNRAWVCMLLNETENTEYSIRFKLKNFGATPSLNTRFHFNVNIDRRGLVEPLHRVDGYKYSHASLVDARNAFCLPGHIGVISPGELRDAELILP